MSRTDVAPVQRARTRKRPLTSAPRWVILVPSLVVLAIFVYGFIGFTGVVSVSQWHGLAQDLAPTDNISKNYVDLFANTRFQSGMRNMVIFTVLFLAVTSLVGLGLALLVNQVVIAKGFFRTLFLFPYSLSFVVTGVAWRWVFNPEGGVNVLFNAIGVDDALRAVGIDDFGPRWLSDPQVFFAVNDAVAKIIPPFGAVQTQFGIPAALIPVVIAACWQFGGFAMAMYLAGLGSIPGEVIEASKVDGASAWQTLRHITLPFLKPITVSLLVILGFTALKIFDLVYVMSGTGPGFATDVPGIFIYQEMFRALNYNTAATAAIVLLVLIAIIVVPYLTRTYRKAGSDV
ncbi:carbohydrate ABC transporter membrane protein 1, CUT1 family [Paramicrobacterium humi]|uniref:Carbohydrate ABC transporter membrane protein 1, CUT1 family n=1 Tax=Paramicrobacterium humi TaxID=640635 RepID=A0A1H4KCS6_9MICO|nr:carbohydrate ABC transporter membrane protein 1, CUT1 family [Microbacterium humi]